MGNARVALAAVVALAAGTGVGAAPRPGAVATEHQLAAAAGSEMLAAGGTVVDAAIAAAAAVCVVHASSCGIGGGGFALVHQAGGADVALDYRESAPAALLRDGPPEQARLRSGGLAVGVPGEAAGLVHLHRRFGHLPLARVLAPAVRLARDGFPLAASPHLAREIARDAELLATDPGLRAIFLAPDGTVPGAEFRLVQLDLARTLAAVAAEGEAAFYRGGTAAAIAAAVQARGGVLSESDLAAYRPLWRHPLEGRFRGRRVVTFPPPGSGAIVLEILGMLAHDDLPALGAGSPTFLHLLADAMAQGFADRAQWYGDPAFTRVPIVDLLSPARLQRLRDALSTVRVAEPASSLARDHGTANVSVVDTEGNAAVITTTINTGFGAGILVPGTGIILNNEMDDFAAAPGVPNAYGLVGSAANAPAAGKRPQSSMSPTLLLAEGRPELAVGGSGGPTIISGTLQVILGVSAFDLSVPAAVAAPRIHAQGTPPVVMAEPGVDPATRAVLGRIGHRVVDGAAIGTVSAAAITSAGEPVAAGDLRKDGGAAVVPR